MLDKVGWHEDGDWRIQWDELLEVGELTPEALEAEEAEEVAETEKELATDE